MPAAAPKPNQGLMLLSPPWPIYHRPSIQLGALKAYLARQFPMIRVEACHLYLQMAAAIGYEIYQAISERTWLAEAVYAALLHPDRFETIEKRFRRAAAGQKRLSHLNFRDLCRQVEQETERWMSQIHWESATIAGFSVSLCQFSATLYLLRKLKQRCPHIIGVVGGSSFSGIPPDTVFELVDEIDVIVSGEGELPLGHLVQSRLMDGRPLDAIEPMSGLYFRRQTPIGGESGFSQVASMDQLPPPDYDDYFAALADLPPDRHFFPTLPFEVSRGCWWQRRRKNGVSGCAFCNLNLQWRGYRQKSAAKAVSEIDGLTRRHQVLSVAFTDNVLPSKPSDRFFESLCGLKKDFRLFAEIRVNTSYRTLRKMRAAGMKELQIGIESLSTALLRKMGKGTRAIENLAVMKHCEALGIRNVSNLILLFPGSDDRDMEETLHTIAFARCFRPLKLVDFWLGLGSPLWQQPALAGFKSVFNHPNWYHLFPKPFAQRFPLMILGYRGDRSRQRRLWKPVRDALKRWEQDWHRLQRGPDCGPVLSYRDGRDFIVIRQRRTGAPAMTHRLAGVSAEIYRSCQQPRSFKDICGRAGPLPQDNIRAFLKMMVAKRLMFEEEDCFLSLAVPENA
jgi:ribosomal peptide maturation radical SAM protein 1